MVASRGFSPEYQDYARAHPLSVDAGSITGRVAHGGKTVHIADVLADPEYDAWVTRSGASIELVSAYLF